MNLWQSLSGMVRIEIVSADTAATLFTIQENGILLHHIESVDELTLRFSVKKADLKPLRMIAHQRHEDIKILARMGFIWQFHALLKRPILTIGILVLLFLTVFLPSRTLFFRVEGNQIVASARIIEFASQQGIHFGGRRRAVRSEYVKNALLHEIPELEWVGVNTTGCVVTISVRERKNSDPPQMQGVSSIVAARDGIIQELTVTAGSPQCKAGQAVKAGQVLISGYTDCGLSIRAQRAEGEVYAITNRHFSFVTPEISSVRSLFSNQTQKYALIIGKKRINFYQDSGNLGASCVKMYEEKYMTLPGGFQLPIAIVKEICISYDQSAPTAISEQEKDMLQSFAERYLPSQMIAGNILSKEEEILQQEGLVCLQGEYVCYEMIGRQRNEEIITP